MAKQRKEPTKTVRLPESVARRVARLAVHFGMTDPDYLAARLAPILDADEAEMLRDMTAELGGRAKPKK